MADRILMGSASVARVVESQVDGLSVALFPQTPSEAWDDPAGEFAPTFWNADGWRIALQTWVIEIDGLTVLVDTGVGNDRDRQAMPPFDHLNTDFLGALQRVGVNPRPSTSSSTPISTPTTSAGTPCGSTSHGSRLSQCPLSDAGTRLPILPPREC
jgi:hypothetical protein